MARRGKSGNKVSHGLVALSSAAVAAVYSAGYIRTKPAAERFAVHAAERRPAAPSVALQTPTPRVSASQHPPPVAPKPARETPAAAAHSEVAPAPAPATPESTADPAQAPAQPEAAPAAPQGAYKDGTYYGWGSCQHGDIQAAVIVYGGVIQSAFVSQCLTRYSCDIIDKAQNQVVDRQAAKVDVISGATESVFAFQDAVAEALSQAK